MLAHPAQSSLVAYRGTSHRWDDEHTVCQRFAEPGRGGAEERAARARAGSRRLLDADQEAEAQDLIRRHTPDELGLPFALWSRAAVRELIRQRCGVALAVRTMGTYLARWGFTAQKPLRRAYEQDPAAVRRWLRRDYPAIVAQAKAAGARSSGATRPACAPTTCAAVATRPRGRTPLVRVCHKRAGLGLISAIANKGELRWMVLDGAVKAPDLLRFLAA